MLVRDLALKSLRMSNRMPDEHREIQIEYFNNIVVVRSGNGLSDSCIYIAYSKTISQPYPDKPSEGIFQISFERGRKNDLLINFLNNVYIKSRCISKTDLCLKFNQECYSVNIEIFPIQTNGDLFRLSVAGINKIIELLDVKTYFLPRVFQFASVSGTVFSDPDDSEYKASEWRMTVAMRSTREFLFIEKTGCGTFAEDIFKIIDKTMTITKSS